MGNPFDQNAQETPGEEQFQDKSGAEFMQELVGEGKKYSSAEEAVRALAHANSHISKLEQENATFRAQVTESKTVEDVLAALQGGQQEQESGNKDKPQDPEQQSSLTAEGVEKLVAELLTKQQTASTAQANHKAVTDKMVEVFGEAKAFEKWDTVQKSLAVDLEAMSQQSPQAVFKLMGIEAGASKSNTTNFSGDANLRDKQEVRPPEGSKRLLDYQLQKGEINRKQYYSLRYQYLQDSERYKA